MMNVTCTAAATMLHLMFTLILVVAACTLIKFSICVCEIVSLESTMEINLIDVARRLHPRLRHRTQYQRPITVCSIVSLSLFLSILSESDVAIGINVFHIEGLNLLKLRPSIWARYRIWQIFKGNGKTVAQMPFVAHTKCKLRFHNGLPRW